MYVSYDMLTGSSVVVQVTLGGLEAEVGALGAVDCVCSGHSRFPNASGVSCCGGASADFPAL